MTRELPSDCEALGLTILAATLSDERRAERFLALTGLSPDEIRARVGDRALLAACIDFLEAHEPDLISVAGVIGIDPATLVAVRSELES